MSKVCWVKAKASKMPFLLMASCLPRHAVSENGIATDPEKIQDVVSWLPPSSVSQVRDYLRFCLYYSCFIGNFLEIANPLPLLTGKNVPFKWTLQCKEAFLNLKEILYSFLSQLCLTLQILGCIN